jgi:hypothetical protein
MHTPAPLTSRMQPAKEEIKGNRERDPSAPHKSVNRERHRCWQILHCDRSIYSEIIYLWDEQGCDIDPHFYFSGLWDALLHIYKYNTYVKKIPPRLKAAMSYFKL